MLTQVTLPLAYHDPLKMFTYRGVGAEGSGLTVEALCMDVKGYGGGVLEGQGGRSSTLVVQEAGAYYTRHIRKLHCLISDMLMSSQCYMS